MKPLFALLFLSLSSVALAADKAPATPKKSEVYGEVVVNNSLQKMLDIQGVRPLYEKCKADHPNIPADVPDCLWKAVSANDNLKKAVQAAYAEEIKAKPNKDGSTPAGRAPASTKSNLTSREESVAIDYESDPAVKALNDFYGKKLDEILDPQKALSKADQDANKILVVDHKKFIDLYKTELGKTIVSAFTSYCLDTDPVKCTDGKKCEVDENESKRKADRNSNMTSIKNGTINLESGSPDAIKWINCIITVPEICSEGTANKESVKRACLIVEYVKAARKNIMIADKQQEFYKEIQYSGYQIVGNTVAINDDKKTSADAVLTLTSKDVQTSLKGSDEKTLKELDQCIDPTTKQVLDAKACEKFLSKNTDANEESIAELTLRQNAQAAELETQLDSKDKVVDYLKNEGYTKDQIESLTSSDQLVKDTKEEIINRFKNQKEAIIAEMASRIREKTSTKNGEITNQDTGKLANIRQEISSRSSDLENLVQFNNVISSYLTITDSSSKNKNSRNTASLFSEVGALDEQSARKLQNQIKSANLKEDKVSSDLNVNTINDAFLKYSNQKKEEN